ncbi:hypothetical protein BP951000_0680 [Brachyspira pilosicoli 95/1000]|uniref:J domain-containing protein n=2 Tax=Brachyspira pilosicoli TaxID=52584 RepID=D8IC06_BRAP9|nr:hypothetical protein BP951000_0680 [Brachyspira pilosicoli 95/1000]
MQSNSDYIDKNISLIDENKDLGKQLNKKIEEYNDLFIKLQEKERELEIKSNNLNAREESLNERANNIRKEEINLNIKKEYIDKEEQRVEKKDRDLDDEREEIKKREKISREVEEKARENIERYEAKYEEAKRDKEYYEEKIEELDARERICREREEDIESRDIDLKGREDTFSSKEEELFESFDKERAEWEEKREEIEKILSEKEKELDRKIAAMEESAIAFEDIKFDDTEDGRKAKIVVKEAIRRSLKLLEESMNEFKELEEKYSSGTFKGFATPIEEISDSFEELKNEFININEHNNESGNIFDLWIQEIEKYIEETDTNIKKHFFSEAYRSCVFGLSYCKSYIKMVEIFNEYTSSGSSDESYSDDEYKDSEGNFMNWYEILWEEKYDKNKYEEYTSYSEKEINKQYKKMMKKYHPDTAENKDEAHEKSTMLNKAKEILLDEYKKQNYDREYMEYFSKKNK